MAVSKQLGDLVECEFDLSCKVHGQALRHTVSEAKFEDLPLHVHCSAQQDMTLPGRLSMGCLGASSTAQRRSLSCWAKYYDLDILSWRNAVYPLFRQEVPGFKEW